MRSLRLGMVQIFHRRYKRGPFLRIRLAHFVHKDPVVDEHHLMTSLTKALVAGRQARTPDVADVTEIHELLIDSVNHLRTSIGSNHVRNPAGPQHAFGERPRELPCLEVLADFQVRHLKPTAVIAHDVLFARLGLCERALHVDDDITPRQNLRQAGIRKDAAKRRMERLTSVAQACLAFRAPSVQSAIMVSQYPILLKILCVSAAVRCGFRYVL